MTNWLNSINEKKEFVIDEDDFEYFEINGEESTEEVNFKLDEAKDDFERC